ncbi:MAG: cytochrome c oxidase subunit [Candidatus Binatota bacterium]|jgi:cytochrome c oxidase subunit 4|nr:cytochrome c oxidase subunit [Candidatus Binatota bacterium]
MAAHVTPPSTYYKIFATLVALTIVTVIVAFFDLGRLNTVVALGIAVFKASLVLLYFMHLRHSERLTALVIGASFFWLAILMVHTLMDYVSRQWIPVPGK